MHRVSDSTSETLSSHSTGLWDNTVLMKWGCIDLTPWPLNKQVCIMNAYRNYDGGTEPECFSVGVFLDGEGGESSRRKSDLSKSVIFLQHKGSSVILNIKYYNTTPLAISFFSLSSRVILFQHHQDKTHPDVVVFRVCTITLQTSSPLLFRASRSNNQESEV